MQVFEHFFSIANIVCDYREPLNHADSVYALRSNSPPARRVLPYPFDKTRLREGIYLYVGDEALYNRSK